MDDRSVHSLDDAVRYMPGITASSYGSDTRADWMRVRGFEPTQFLDGLPLPKACTPTRNRNLEPRPPGPAARPGLLRLRPDPAGRPAGHGQPPPEQRRQHEIQLQYGSDNHRQINFASTGKIDDAGQFLYGVSGVVRDSGTQIDHIDNKRYNIAPSLTWNIDDDTKLTLLSQFTRDDTGITSQFLPIQGTKIDMPFGMSPTTRTSATRTGNSTTAPTTRWAMRSNTGSTMSGSSSRTCATPSRICRSRPSPSVLTRTPRWTIRQRRAHHHQR
jgi:iron complex outermembrane receptor protein